jgi:succinyl-CoA synthetase beta subunit
MKIHEYQAKQLFSQYGIPVPKGGSARNSWEAYETAKAIGGETFVVKAQIHAGGRGKAGGVKVVKGLESVSKAAEELIGKTLITPQTGSEGKRVGRLLVEQGLDIETELYFSILVDRDQKGPVIIASAEGGMDIEQLAVESPEKILMVPIDPLEGFSAYHARKVAFGLGLSGAAAKGAMGLVKNAYKAFWELDCSLLEINPLVVTKDGSVVALDAKLNIDDNALYRHKDVAAMRDFDEEEPLEILANRFGVDFVKLDGRVGCMVNGAGLAMATMDIILAVGEQPANFLDIKGGANVDNVIAAFKLLMGDPNVEVVLINIFGGIVRCDMVAEGILAAMKEVEVKVPVIVRIQGTNAEQGRAILEKADFPFIVGENLEDAADRVVLALKGGDR